MIHSMWSEVVCIPEIEGALFNEKTPHDFRWTRGGNWASGEGCKAWGWWKVQDENNPYLVLLIHSSLASSHLETCESVFGLAFFRGCSTRLQIHHRRIWNPHYFTQKHFTHGAAITFLGWGHPREKCLGQNDIFSFPPFPTRLNDQQGCPKFRQHRVLVSSGQAEF